MPIDLTKKFVPAIGYIRCKNADGSYMIDEETGQPAYARGHSPASKIWEVANAIRRRNVMKRVRENGGKIEAAQDEPEDIIAFLIAVTEEFVGVTVPLPEGETGAKALVRAIYNNAELGFMRDHMDADFKDWGSFLPKPPSGSTSGSANLPG